MKNLNNLTQRQKTSIKIIAATLLVVLALLAVLYLPKAFAGSDTAKKETTTQQTTSSEKNTSSKDDKKDKESSKKDDKKDNDSNKKEDTDKKDTADSKPAEASTNNSNATSSNTSTTSNNNAAQTASSSNTTSNNTAAPAPVEQTKTPIYETVQHDEVGHYETQVVSEAWDEPVYSDVIIGNQTGRQYNSNAEFIDQVDPDDPNSDTTYHVAQVQTGTIHHDAVTQQVWVVDRAAWDEQVVVGYR